MNQTKTAERLPAATVAVLENYLGGRSAAVQDVIAGSQPAGCSSRVGKVRSRVTSMGRVPRDRFVRTQ